MHDTSGTNLFVMARRYRCFNRDCPRDKAGVAKAATDRLTRNLPRADVEGGGKRELTSEEIHSIRNGQVSGMQASVVKGLLRGDSGFTITDKR